MEEGKRKYYGKIALKVGVVAFILLGLLLAYKLAIFYIPFIIAIIVSSIVEPITKFLNKKCKLNRKIASVISLLIILTIIGLILGLIIGKVVQETTNLLENLNIYCMQAYDFGMKIFDDFKNGNLQIPDEIIQIAKNSLGGIIDGVKSVVFYTLDKILNFVSSVPRMITYTIITLLAILFTCFDRELVIEQVKRQIPKKWLEKSKQVIKETCSATFNYIKAEVKLSGICFIIVLISLWVLSIIGFDVKYPVSMAIFIGFIDLLPLFGAGTVMIPWSIYLFIIGNIPLAIAVILIWVAWYILKQVLEPKMVSHQIGMHPIFTLLGMYTGFRLVGVFGLMLGPIAMLMIKNIFGELIKKGILKEFFEME